MAYSRKKFSRKSSRKGTKRTYKRKSYSKRVTPLKKLVRREISRNIENKCSQYYDGVAGLSSVNSAAFGATNMFPIGPTSAFGIVINQGVAQSARIGNTIKTKKLVVKGTMFPLPTGGSNLSPVPTQVKIWFLYDKTNPTSEPDPKGSADFFQLGGSSKGFANNLTDMWAPVNADRWRVLTSKTYKLAYANYGGATSSTPVVQAAQYWANNDFKMNWNFSFDLTKHYPKIVKFNDNNSAPTTRGLFMLVEYVAADGSALAADRQYVQMQYMVDYHFEDA